MRLQNWSKLLLIAGLFSTGFSVGTSQISAVSASVLVDPRIRREAPNTEVPTPSNSSTSTPTQASDNIVEVASSTDGFRTLTSAITVANIGSVLSDEGPLTVFAPTDAAFAALPAGTLDSLLLPDNRDLLIKLLYNHVSYGDISSEQLISGQIGGQITTFDGTVDVAVMPTGIQVGQATVIQADVDASNGVIHAVDQVLLPVGFADQLQARIDGVESSVDETAASTSTAEPVDTQAVDTQTANAQIEETQTVEPSTAAGEDAPVRALW